MLKNYFTIALRNFIKDFRFSLINTIGFTLGLFSFFVIIFYISHEESYDSFQVQADRIYRMGWEMKSPDAKTRYAVSSAAPAPDMMDVFPEIESFCRFCDYDDGFVSYINQDFRYNNWLFADSGFFELFSFPLIQGNEATCLSNPFSIVITEELAHKIFKDKNPLGKTLRWENEHNFTITGIIKNPPSNSHFQFDILASYSTLYKMDGLWMHWDGGIMHYSYLLFREGNTPEDLEGKIEDFYFEKINYKYEKSGWKITPFFENLKDLHLNSDAEAGMNAGGSTESNRLFLIIALIILSLACVNYMNLSTARYSLRTKEVGIRKVFGAGRHQVILQFLGESIVFVLFSTVLAFICVEVTRSWIGDLSNTDMKIYSVDNIKVFLLVPLIVIATGILAGSYPSLYLSSFPPIVILTKNARTSKRRISFRNILVVFQFSASIALIICTLIVNAQMKFLLNKDLGFEKDYLIVLPFTSDAFAQKHEILQEEFSKISGVQSTAVCGYFPGSGNTTEGFLPEGYENPILINRISVGFNYINTMKIKLTEGRNFSKDFLSDSSAILVNEAFVRKMGWEEPVGKIVHRGIDMKIIGVVHDFYYSSMHSPISPLILNLHPYNGFNYLLVRVNPGSYRKIIKKMEKIWKEKDPAEPFDVNFADSNFEKLYIKDIQYKKFFTLFSVLATVLAALGLFGLAAFEAENRTKEIGIRKILGSTSGKITQLLLKNFLLWVILGNILAWPAAYFFTESWLTNFAEKTTLKPWFFLTGAVISVLVAILTVWSRSYRISNLNPAETIRYE